MELPNFWSIIGALCWVVGSTWFGRTYGKQFQERVEFLRDVQNRLEVLKQEIIFFKGVLADSFQKAAASQGPSQALFVMMLEALQKEEQSDVANMWNFCCKKVCKEIYLTQEERDTIGAIGHLLGTSDVDGQRNNLEAIGAQLQRLEAKAEEARKKNQPLWQKIGPIAGVAVAVFLL